MDWSRPTAQPTVPVALRWCSLPSQTLLVASLGLRSIYPQFGYLQRGLQRLLDPVDEHELEPLALVLGDLGDLAVVAVRDDHPLDPGALGGERLLLQAADRQHLPGQRELAGHRHVAVHGLAADER